MTLKYACTIAAGVLLLTAAVSLSPSQEIDNQPPPIETMADLEALFADEPSYKEIQQAAMRYAEVHPEKIASWRRGASLRAFLPKVTFQYDLARDYDFQSSTTFESSVGSTYSLGFDQGEQIKTLEREYYGEEDTGDIQWSSYNEWRTEVTEGWSSEEKWGEDADEGTESGSSSGRSETKDWGIRLEWDLGDYLYNSEQRYISREARDLVELRQDVLEEVNTYFFDRRRAQIEMLFSPPADVRSKIDLQLRVAQITATIDALTGGYLSNALKEAKK